MAEDDANKRQERHQRALAAGSGAFLGGAAAGPPGAVLSALLGPELEPLVKGVWEELSAGARRRQAEVLASAIDGGIPEDELGRRLNASERTQLLTGFALSAATRTVWQDKVRTLGRSLASGLLADDGAKIDTEQMIIAAIADIEGPQLAMLEFLVAWRRGESLGDPLISGPLDLPNESRSQTPDGSWSVAWRVWSRELIAYARPSLSPLAPSLLGTLQRHDLVVQNDNAGEAIEGYAKAYERKFSEAIGHGVDRRVTRVPKVLNPARLVPEPTWSPTELGEQVFLRFRDAGTQLDDVWTSGSAEQQE